MNQGSRRRNHRCSRSSTRRRHHRRHASPLGRHRRMRSTALRKSTAAEAEKHDWQSNKDASHGGLQELLPQDPSPIRRILHQQSYL